MKKSIIYTFLVLFIASCGASKVGNTAQVGESTYKEKATEILGKDLAFTKNDSKSYVLCVNEIKGTPKQPRNTISFVVINLNNNSVALENKIEGGTVKWSDNLEVEIYRTPGIMRDDQTREDFITLYNVETGKSYPKKNVEQH